MKPPKSSFSSSVPSSVTLVTLVPVYSGLGVDERIRATSRALLRSYLLWLGVFLLLVITALEHHMRTAKWPHWSVRLIFIK